MTHLYFHADTSTIQAYAIGIGFALISGQDHDPLLVNYHAAGHFLGSQAHPDRHTYRSMLQ